MFRNIGDEIERDMKKMERQMDRDFENMKREMDKDFETSFDMNAGFGSFPHHSHPHQRPHPHHPSRPHLSESELEAIRLQELQRIEEARLEEERFRAEEAARAEERRLQELKRAEERKIREQQRREEALHAAEEAKRAEQRRIKAAREAEERRIAEEKHLAALKLQEEQEETKRIAVYEAHKNLIPLAAELAFLELQQQVNALVPLTNPIPRFQESVKKGLPIEGSITLFFNILQNQKMASVNKLELINFLLNERGYLPYLNILFSTPVIEILLADNDPSVLLKSLYKKAVFECEIVMLPDLENKIWQKLITAGLAQEILDTFYHSKCPIEKTIQFLETWCILCNPSLPQGLENFYGAVLSNYKNKMSDKFFEQLQKSFFNAGGNWASFMCVVINVGMKTAKISLLFEEWSKSLSLQDIGGFVNYYMTMLTTKVEEKRLKIDFAMLKKILMLDENAGNYLYDSLVNIGSSKEILIQFLECWTASYHLPHDFTQVKKHYIDLVLKDDFNTLLPGEEKMWNVILASDKNSGIEIFNNLLYHFANKSKLLKFVECWVSTLNSDEDIIAAYKHVKQECSKTSFQDFRFEVRKIAEIRIQELVVEHKPILHENTVESWLKYTRPSFFKRVCSQGQSSYDVYGELRKNKPQALPNFNYEKDQAQDDINEKLIKSGEKGDFSFRRK